jgi:AcrR family transcriptional regulator
MAASRGWQAMTPGDLHRRKLQLVQALASGLSVTEAAERAGISPRTAYRYLRDEAVVQALQCIERELLQVLARRLAALAVRATEALERALQDDGVPWSVRVRAADALLDHAEKLAYLARLEERLSELEREAHDVRTVTW